MATVCWDFRRRSQGPVVGRGRVARSATGRYVYAPRGAERGGATGSHNDRPSWVVLGWRRGACRGYRDILGTRRYGFSTWQRTKRFLRGFVSKRLVVGSRRRCDYRLSDPQRIGIGAPSREDQRSSRSCQSRGSPWLGQASARQPRSEGRAEPPADLWEGESLYVPLARVLGTRKYLARGVMPVAIRWPNPTLDEA